jgi:hypothetical protein
MQLVQVLYYKPESRGFELLIPVVERSDARVCGRSLAGVAGSNSAGAWMFVLCIVSKVKKVKCGTINKKKLVWIKFKQRTREFKKIPPGTWMFVLCAVNKDKWQNVGQSRQSTKYWWSTEYKRIQKGVPMRSLRFFIYLILPVALWPWNRLSL